VLEEREGRNQGEGRGGRGGKDAVVGPTSIHGELQSGAIYWTEFG